MSKATSLARRLLLFALCAPAAAMAQAPAWPARPIKLIVPYPPGGLTDVLARLMSQKAGEQLGQAIVVENRPGASTIVGAGWLGDFDEPVLSLSKGSVRTGRVWTPTGNPGAHKVEP